MTKWYNGVEVLDIETIWTGDVKETHPYAFLCTIDGEPVLYLLSAQVVKNTTDTLLLYSLADGVYCYCYIENDAWQQSAQLVQGEGASLGTNIIEPFWCSWDMYGSGDVLYLAASEPSDTAPGDEGSDNTTDDATGGETEEEKPTVFTVTHKLRMDLQQRGVRPRIDVAQGDTDTRILEITLTSGGASWNPHSDSTVLVTYGRSNGTGGVYDTLHDGSAAGTIAGNVVTVTLVPEMTAVAGEVRAAVRLIHKNSGDVISTFAFDIMVDADPAVSAANASGNYINWFGHNEAPLPTTVASVMTDSAITVTAAYADGSTIDTVINLDANGDPVSVTKAGVTCTLTWEGFDA